MLKKALEYISPIASRLKQDIFFIFDNDETSISDFDTDRIHVRRLRYIRGEGERYDGIEDLLPSCVFADEFFDEVTKSKSKSKTTIIRTLNKVRLQKHVCSTRRRMEDFNEFRYILDDLTKTLGL